MGVSLRGTAIATALAKGAYGADLIRTRSLRRHADTFGMQVGIQVRVVTWSREATQRVLALARGTLATVAPTSSNACTPGWLGPVAHRTTSGRSSASPRGSERSHA